MVSIINDFACYFIIFILSIYLYGSGNDHVYGDLYNTAESFWIQFYNILCNHSANNAQRICPVAGLERMPTGSAASQMIQVI